MGKRGSFVSTQVGGKEAKINVLLAISCLSEQTSL